MASGSKMEPRTMGCHRGCASPSLNLDVFRMVLNHLSVADLKQVAVVSRALHEEALREILVQGVCFHGQATKLKAFCKFMLGRDRPLFPFLRSIDIDVTNGHSPDDFNPNDLFAVLSRATHLRDLRVHWTDPLFTSDCDEGLKTIISNLQHLRYLRLVTTDQNAADKHVAETIVGLRSQLNTLEAHCQHPLPHVNHHFPHNLGEYQTHLRILRICSPDLTSTPWVPLPSVRTLELLWPKSRPISLRHLARTFPCLRELIICLGLPWTSSRIRDLDPDQVRAREDALAFQRTGGGWKGLDVLTTSTVPEAWVLGLACPVGSARLGLYRVEDHAAFVDVVSAARPRRVTMALECEKGCAHPEGGQSVFLFPTDAGPGTGAVTHAVVFLMLHIVRYPALSSVDQNTTGIIETVGSHIKHSRLEYLHVAIGVESAFGPEEYSKPECDIYEHVLNPSSVVLYLLRPVFMGIDIELLVSGLAAAGDHLQTIALTISARGQSVWTIERNDDGRTITKRGSAREIIEREERSYINPL